MQVGFRLQVCSVALLVLGCNALVVSPDAGTDAPAEAGPRDVARVDAPADDGPPDTPCAYPGLPYGSRECNTLRPFELTACANWSQDGGLWRFDQAGFCTARATYLSFAAVWCVPCQNETAMLEYYVNQRYAGLGVRVVQILAQGVDRGPITPTPCQSWVNRFGLGNPVLMDPLFITQPYVPGAAFPGSMVVDGRGRIRWRHYGSQSDITEIRRQIDRTLSDPDLCGP